ncbi:putative holin, partial [Enterobacter hormaechei]|uniref:putative holin n=1 Tax=Enterobacter hormaechei TaxID=158836 RepID=UPI0035250016
MTSVTFASLFSGTDAGVYVGAFAGAVVYVLSSTELTRLAQVGYFVASFLIGILAASVSTDILNILIGKFLPGGIVI